MAEDNANPQRAQALSMNSPRRSRRPERHANRAEQPAPGSTL